MHKTILPILLAATLLCAGEEALDITREFSLKGEKASLTIEGEKVTVTIGNRSTPLANAPLSGDMEAVVSIIGEDGLVVIDDYNFDGYNDIAIAHAVGYGGVNVFRNYYFYDPRKRTFRNVLSNVNNLEIDGKTLTTQVRSGPGYYTLVYRIKDSGPYLSRRSEWLGGVLEMTEEFDNHGQRTGRHFKPSILEVAADRAYLHDAPDEKSKTAGYILKGERVRVTGIDRSLRWTEVEYRHPKRTYRKWIQLENLKATR